MSLSETIRKTRQKRKEAAREKRIDTKEKARQERMKKKRSVDKKWKGRGATGRVEAKKEKDAVINEWYEKHNKAIDDWDKEHKKATTDWFEDHELIREHGTDAPKARSFNTPSRKRGGGIVNRGMGVALKGGGAVTRS